MSVALNVIWWLLKPVSLLLIYLTFLYEDEEGKIQDRIIELWVRLDDRRSTSLSWAAILIQSAARLVAGAMDYFFGTKPVSFRLLGTSFFFSLASLEPFLGFSPHPNSHWPFTGPYHWTHLFQAILYLALGMVPAFTKNRWFLGVWYICIIRVMYTFVFAVLIVFAGKHGSLGLASNLLVGATTGLGMSFLCDILWISFARKLLRRVLAALGTQQVYWSVLFACFMLVVMLTVFPAIAGLTILDTLSRINVLPSTLLFVGVAMIFSFALNGVGLLACLAAFAFSGAMLLHGLVWPTLQRPLYFLQRQGVIENKKLLWGVGIALLLLPKPQTMSALFELLVSKLASVL